MPLDEMKIQANTSGNAVDEKGIDISHYQNEWAKDVEARRSWWAMMNYHYLMYKGIQLLNYTYSRETLEQMGLHIHVPRTFATIEALRSKTNRDIDIVCKWSNQKNKNKAEASSHMLTGEWARAHANNPKNSALSDAFTYGSGYMLSYFAREMGKIPKVNIAKKNPKIKKATLEEQVLYEGMKVKNLDPFYVVPDRRAKTWDHGEPNSPQRVWYYEIWDYDAWIKECKVKGYDSSGVQKGGFIQEFDYVRRLLDAIYLQNTYLNLRTRDQGTLVAGNIYELPKMDTSNMVMVLHCFEPDKYTIFAGGSWTVCHTGINEHPQQIIPIFCLKDYYVPNELEGIGEPEVLRWQQYEENKIHNLSYLQILMNTVNRYAVVEELLKDPIEVRMGNPLKNIRLKYMPNIKVGDAVQPLQGQKLEYPAEFLQEVKNIGQSATGMTDYNMGANKSQADTLGEAELMNSAGNDRILQKIVEVENRCIVPILEHWMLGIPYFYTDELEYRLNSGKGTVKFLPINRENDANPNFVSQYAIQEGVFKAGIAKVSDIFLSEGYLDIVFIDDLLEKYDIEIKTSISGLLHQDLLQKYMQALNAARADNMDLIKTGRPPAWDTTKLTEDLLRQFPDILSDPEEYKLQAPPQQMPGQQPQQVPGQPQQGNQMGMPGGTPPQQPNLPNQPQMSQAPTKGAQALPPAIAG